MVTSFRSWEVPQLQKWTTKSAAGLTINVDSHRRCGSLLLNVHTQWIVVQQDTTGRPIYTIYLAPGLPTTVVPGVNGSLMGPLNSDGKIFHGLHVSQRNPAPGG
jgi:hypothetical protein